MKIVLLGATDFVGSALLKEALASRAACAHYRTMRVTSPRALLNVSRHEDAFRQLTASERCSASAAMWPWQPVGR